MQMPSSWEDYNLGLIQIPRIKEPTILGVSAYFHDSSACLVANGAVVAAVEEERLSRLKHDPGFPFRAVRYCLTAANQRPDIVAFFENPDLKLNRILTLMSAASSERGSMEDVLRIWKTTKSNQAIERTLRDTVRFDGPIVFLEHHLSHAASTYLQSGFDESAVVTIDGVGEECTTTIGLGTHGKITLHKKVMFPHSIGLFYTAMTVFLGFEPFEGEYKVMGLASYGDNSRKTNPFYRKLNNCIASFGDGSFVTDMEFFGHDTIGHKAYKPALIDLLEIAPRKPGDGVSAVYMDIAAAAQMITQDLVMGVLNYAYELTKCENLCYAGGVALNGVINAKIFLETPFKRLFIQPAAGDAGTSLGAAKYVQCLAEEGANPNHSACVYLGPSYTTDEIKAFLNNKGVSYQEYTQDNALIDVTALLLSQDNIVAWFQDRLEWGPRALGARSILANPMRAEMRDKVNLVIKHREQFRPFAPAICAEQASQYFECPQPLPDPMSYMLMVYPVREEKRHLIPAVTHVDGTARPQAVGAGMNRLFYNLIRKFGDITGVPVLLNTSFNLSGEPIVCSPHDALRTFSLTEIDYLVLGRILIARRDLSGSEFDLH